jgi:hypothetical protein
MSLGTLLDDKKHNMETTYFQPIANPHDGSRKRVTQDEKDPAIGKVTPSSPIAEHVQ